MAKDKVCKNCKKFVEGDVCPVCKSNQFTTIYKGRIFILDANKSYIAEQMDIKVKGKYALKVR